MAIRGSLSEVPLSEVIQLVCSSGKSGCLSVADGYNFGNIFVKDGMIAYATILNREQRIGDILLSKQIIDSDTLLRALEIQMSEEEKTLGEILIETKAITREKLESEIKSQIERVVFEMLTWESGYFNFEENLMPTSQDDTISLSAQELLLEGSRQIDELKKIEDKIPQPETVLLRKSDVGDVVLTPEEKKILELVDGTRSVDDIQKMSEYSFSETCRIIYGLVTAGLLKRPEKSLEDKQKTPDISEYKNLGLAFYKTKMYDEAEREYKRILEIDDSNSEAFFYLGLIHLARCNHEKARENLLKAAEHQRHPSILADLGYVCLKLGLYDEAIQHLKQSQDFASGSRNGRCCLAIAYYMKGDLDSGADIFKAIIDESPDVMTPYIYLPMILLKQGDIEAAALCLSDAIKRFPKLPIFTNNLAVLCENLGKPEEAERLYRRAFEMDPHDELVCRNLADFYYETQIFGAARDFYEKIPEDKKDWQVLFKLGNISLRQGETENALGYWEKAHSLDPSQEIVVRNIERLRKSKAE